MRHTPLHRSACILLALTFTGQVTQAGGRETERELIVEPASIEIESGDETRIVAYVKDADGERSDEEVFFFSRARRSVTVDKEGQVVALQPGAFEIVVRTKRPSGEDSEAQRLSTTIPVTVNAPPLERLELTLPAGMIHAGTRIDLGIVAMDVRSRPRPEPEVSLTSDTPSVASFDAFDKLTAHRPGSFTVHATCESLTAERTFEVHANPVASLIVVADASHVRTGDVVHFVVEARDASGSPVSGVPVQLSVVSEPDDTLGQPASGQVEQDGRFVAETPGLYSIIATCGNTVARASVRADARNVGGAFKLVGRGPVADMHTSDLWVWEGVDGRDYAVTGTWGANGDTLFWDVTDPENIEQISKITVDARTINDVKVSADGRICVVSREGASDRKNGIVLIDVLDPRNPKIISTFDEDLTGGVHNVFIDGSNVYALSAGRRYDVIDMADQASPRRVGSFELDTPGHSIHDVWIDAGLAYSSNWGDGIQIVDVGNGMRGGTPENPVRVASYAYPSGWNHAAFPYRSAQTERWYVLAGDEAFPNGLNITDTPTYPRGWLHFIDFTDLEQPREVARYQVPEAGTHNFWVDGDLCYVAYYNAGLRVIDMSGELMGDLYRQGREIAWFLPDDPDGYIANAPMTWGPQPHKGNIFFSDWNSGLWCVRLELPDTLKPDAESAR
ncbi:MAG: hypothetical protein ACI8QZ_000263 [Chlamydiales bacterium]|jgi:hypothetical protein